jgi:hypothetical protein
MSIFADKLLDRVKLTLRRTEDIYDDEIKSYIDTVADDLKDVGILSFYFNGEGEVDTKILQAVRWYCLSVFGLYNADMEKYDKAYRSLKATLATQRKYTEKGYETEDVINIRAMQEQIQKNTKDISDLKEVVVPIPEEDITQMFEEERNEQS